VSRGSFPLMINIYHNPSKYSIAVIQTPTPTPTTQSISRENASDTAVSPTSKPWAAGKSRVGLGPKYNLTLI